MGPDFFCPGGWWLFPTIRPIIMLIVVVTVLSHIFGRGGFRLPGQGSQKPESALEILQKRYARGEITKEEFDQIRRDLGTWGEVIVVAGLSSEDKQRIEAGVRARYSQVALSPAGQFRYPTGRGALEALGYPDQILQALPATVLAGYCGVGNPFSLADFRPGEQILDIGCGAGVDSLVAAILTGPAGAVTGIDPTPAMVARARENGRLAGVTNVTFQEAAADALPFPDNSFDKVISNGVFNLVVAKATALAEVYRVLKPGGRFLLADQVLVAELAATTAFRVDNWARWLGGAMPGMDFLALLRQAAFTEVKLVAATGFNSSPQTRGVLFRAVKPAATATGYQPLRPGTPAAVPPCPPVPASGATWSPPSTKTPGESKTIAPQATTEPDGAWPAAGAPGEPQK